MGQTQRRGRARLSPQERQEMAEDSLRRAQDGHSLRNDMAVIVGFAERGISDVRPRENVLTFWGWKALGRSVKKGEKALAVPVIIRTPGEPAPTASDPDATTGGRSMRKTAYVFHVSQTEPDTRQAAHVRRSADTVEALAAALRQGGPAPGADGLQAWASSLDSEDDDS